MHLVCLGVMKKLLLLWRGEKGKATDRRPRKTSRSNKQAKDRVFRLSSSSQKTINERIMTCSKRLPEEFQRKGRSLNDLEDWKAVEFRTFLLYTGPLVLKGVLPEEQYEHFLHFHAAIRILCSPSSTESQINYADECLKYFSYQFGVLYGRYQLIYNVHTLSHLANECRMLKGPLDCFSAFPFENFLGRLKVLLRGTRRPLAQLKKRLSEIDNFDNFVEGDVIKHHYGPYAFHFESIKARPADSFVISNKCRVLKIEGKTKEFLSFKEYCLKDERGNFINLYEFPMKAHLLKIFVCDTHEQDEEGDNIIMPIADCRDVVKCVSLNYEKSLVFFPLLHNL